MFASVLFDFALRKEHLEYKLVVIVALTEHFDGTISSNIILPFPLNPYHKTDGTSLLILFLVLSNDDNLSMTNPIVQNL